MTPCFCGRQAVRITPRGSWVCDDHGPPPLRSVTWADIPIAHRIMKQGKSLRQTANFLGVPMADLDQFLWHAMGRLPPAPHRPAPMF